MEVLGLGLGLGLRLGLVYALAICMLDSRAVRNFHRTSTEGHDETLVRVFDVRLEKLSDSKNYFGFVVDEFSKREHTIKSQGF